MSIQTAAGLDFGFLTEDRMDRELCLLYWAVNADGSWQYPVAAIGERFGVPVWQVAGLVAERCRAFFSDEACDVCGDRRGPSTARYLEDLEALLTSENWPDEWIEDARELHRVVAFEECLEYLRVTLADHGFDLEPGEKLSLVLRSILRHFSIGQAYNFIWRASTNAAAFYVRERTSRAHARNIVPGSLQRMAERALVESWVVKAYRRDRRVPESQVRGIIYLSAQHD